PSLQSLHERAQLGRYLEPEDLPGRSGDHDGPRSGRSLAARGAGTPGLSGRPVHRVRAAPVARVCASLAALAALPTCTPGPARATGPPRASGCHDAGEEGVVERHDDVDPPATSPGSTRSAVAAVPSGSPGLRRAARGPGGAIGPFRTSDAGAPAAPARLEHQPVCRRHGARIL